MNATEKGRNSWAIKLFDFCTDEVMIQTALLFADMAQQEHTI